MSVKYFYKGKSLAQYCRENNLSYIAVIKRMERAIEKGESYNLDEIVEKISMGEKQDNYTNHIYKGMKLIEYCNNNGIIYDSIAQKITKMKKSEKYQGLSKDEIIDIAITTYRTGGAPVKYFYEGISLVEYCNQNRLNYPVIVKDIHKFKKENKSLSIEEIIEMAINYKSELKYPTYIYKGMLLSEYCKENDLDYLLIKSRITRFKKMEKYNGYDIEKIIEEAIKLKPMEVKYYYNGVSLAKYCKDNNLNYNKIIQRIGDARASDKYKDLPLERIVELSLLDADKNFSIKYYYKGMRLSDYCRENELNLNDIRGRIVKLKNEEKYKDYDIEKIIEMALDVKPNQKKVYFYKGMTLGEYCELHNLNYNSIRNTIKNKRKLEEYKDLDINEVVEMVVEKYLDKKSRYMYKGVLLRQYCKDNNLEYDAVVEKIKTLERLDENSRLSRHELIEISLAVKETRDQKSKYMYKGYTLRKYCSLNGISYERVRYKFNQLRALEENKDLSDEELMEKSIDDKPIYSNKYIYKGESLEKYCFDNDISYIGVLKRLKTLEAKEAYKCYNQEQLIYFALTCSRTSIYHYKGLPLNIYCKENGIDYITLIQRTYFLKRTGKYEGKSSSELIDIALSAKYDSSKYNYNGISLSEYCKNNELSEKLIKSKINTLKKRIEYQGYTIDMLVKEVVTKMMESKNR